MVKKKRKSRFTKGSAAAKAYMAKIRPKRGRKSKSIIRTSSPKKRMARRRYRRAIRRYKQKPTIPMAVVGGFLAGMYDPIRNAIGGNFEQAMKDLTWNYTGYNMDSGQIEIAGLQKGLVPLAAGLGAHKVIGGWLGANRALGKAGIPLIRI